MEYITLTKSSIASEHICCAFSDKKCQASYEAKKVWLQKEFENGYVFKRLNERAKVFLEYGPAESAWLPINAPNHLVLGCFWVSGKYKRTGHGKQLLAEAVQEAKAQGKDGLVAVVGKKKYHFMSDTQWLMKQGFKIVDELPDGFVLIRLALNKISEQPVFNQYAKARKIDSNSCIVYYSNRCPYSEYHVQTSLTESCQKRNIPLKIIKLKTQKQAFKSPTPATIFSMYYGGKFVTTDISACMDTRFDKFIRT